MNHDPGIIEGVITAIVIVVMWYWGLKFVGRMLLKWSEVCENRLGKYPKICTAAVFSPPVVFTIILAYTATTEGGHNTAEFSWIVFLSFFVGIGMGTMLLFTIALAFADSDK